MPFPGGWGGVERTLDPRRLLDTCAMLVLLETLLGGAALASYLFISCNFNPFNVSLKVNCFSKIYITARLRAAGKSAKTGGNSRGVPTKLALERQ